MDGNPGKVGDYAFLYGYWNDHAFYQLKVKRLSELDPGFQWSMADVVNGSSLGYETSEQFTARSTNFVQLASVQPGVNEVNFTLGLLDASNPDISALLMKDSKVVATKVQPDYLDIKARAVMDGPRVFLSVSGNNNGWAAPQLNLHAQVFHEGGAYQEQSFILGRVDALADFDYDEYFTLDENVSTAPVKVIMAQLDWGTGQHILQAWPPPPVVPFYAHSFFRSGIGVMVAVVILWVGIPALFRAVRRLFGGPMLLVLLIIAVPACSSGGSGWDREYELSVEPEFPTVSRMDADSIQATAEDFLASPQWAGIVGSQKWDLSDVSVLTRNGIRVGIGGNAVFDDAVGASGNLTFVRCGQEETWSPDPEEDQMIEMGGLHFRMLDRNGRIYHALPMNRDGALPSMEDIRYFAGATPHACEW